MSPDLHFQVHVGLDIGGLRGAMLDCEVWRKIVEEFSIEDHPK